MAEAVERARRHAPQVSFATDLRPVALEGVPDRLGRAVNNLLANAAAYSPPRRRGGGRRCARAGWPCAITGRACRPDELEQIFDRFRRGSSAREQAGSGLGLAIVKQVAEGHGGRAEARLAPGGGLEVRLVLPGARAVAAPDGDTGPNHVRSPSETDADRTRFA